MILQLHSSIANEKKNPAHAVFLIVLNRGQIVGNKKPNGINRIRFQIHVVIPSEENGSKLISSER